LPCQLTVAWASVIVTRDPASLSDSATKPALADGTIEAFREVRRCPLLLRVPANPIGYECDARFDRLYRANRGLDRDQDGIACEKK